MTIYAHFLLIFRVLPQKYIKITFLGCHDPSGGVLALVMGMVCDKDAEAMFEAEVEHGATEHVTMIQMVQGIPVIERMWIISRVSIIQRI